MKQINFNRVARALTHFSTHGYKRTDLDIGSDIDEVLMEEGKHLYVLPVGKSFGISLYLVMSNERTSTSTMTESEKTFFDREIHYELMAMVRSTKVFFNNENVQTNLIEINNEKIELHDKHTGNVLAVFEFVQKGNVEYKIAKVLEEPLFAFLTDK